MGHIDKVVVVCSGRIEGHHAQAIGQFMNWLEYKKHRNQFVFVYNKADHCDSEEEKLQNVAGMLELLGAKQVTRTLTDDLAEGQQSKVVSGIHTGFPKKVRSSIFNQKLSTLVSQKKAKFEAIEEDYNKLWRATTFDNEKYDRIKVSKESCSIL